MGMIVTSHTFVLPEVKSGYESFGWSLSRGMYSGPLGPGAVATGVLVAVVAVCSVCTA